MFAKTATLATNKTNYNLLFCTCLRLCGALDWGLVGVLHSMASHLDLSKDIITASAKLCLVLRTAIWWTMVGWHLGMWHRLHDGKGLVREIVKPMAKNFPKPIHRALSRARLIQNKTTSIPNPLNKQALPQALKFISRSGYCNKPKKHLPS
jgi:uncharacterized membrane protein YuzA (DUF378 family)